MAYAQKLVSSGETDGSIICLSLITKSNLFELSLALEKLASNMEDYYPEKWLYIILNDVFHRKHEFEDPLGEVEKIYADFDYPEEIESFVRYMPPTDGYIPAEHSLEENISRLYANWEKFLINRAP